MRGRGGGAGRAPVQDPGRFELSEFTVVIAQEQFGYPTPPYDFFRRPLFNSTRSAQIVSFALSHGDALTKVIRVRVEVSGDHSSGF